MRGEWWKCYSKSHKMKKIFLVIFLVLSFFLSNKVVSAQTCGGSIECCNAPLVDGCSCARDLFGNCPVSCRTRECNAGSQVMTGQCFPGGPNSCGTQSGACSNDPERVMSVGCYTTGSCASGTIYCGGSIQACCPNTQTCTAWINAGGCGANPPDPDPGGPPSNPPACTDIGANWTTNRDQFTFALGGPNSPNWDPVENRFFIETDTGSTGMVTLTWSGGRFGTIDTTEYRFVPWNTSTNTSQVDSGGNTGCDHVRARCGTMSGSPRTITTRLRDYRYWRLRVRFRDNCNARWSSWRDQIVRLDGEVTGRVMVLDAGATVAQSGPNGRCVATGTTSAYASYPGSVTLSVDGYSQTDTTINTTTARYRDWIAYTYPGRITATLNGVPAGLTVACPAGGSYTSSNSTIPAPNFGGSSNSDYIDTDFFLCTSGSAPAAPGITAPAASPTKTYTAGGVVTFNGTKPSGNQVEYQVIPASIYGAAAGSDACPAGASCGTTGSMGFTTYSGSFTPTTSNYVLRVRTTSTACGAALNSAWTTRTFAVWGSITGQVFNDPAATCNAATAPALAGGTLNVSNALPHSETVTNTGAAYTLTVPWGSGAATVTHANGSPTLCSCPTPVNPNIGCQRFGYSSTQNHTGVNFFRTTTSAAWWQVNGGPIMALGTAADTVRSHIPDSAITPYLITGSAGTAGYTTGYIVTGGGTNTVDLKSDPGAQDDFVDQDGRNIIATAVPTEETFDTFVRRYQFPQTRQSDFTGVGSYPPANNATEPTLAPRNGVNAYYSTSNLTVNSAWNIANGETKVVFVQGDLTFGPAATTTVAQGGFLAFIVSGNITFNADIGSDTASSVTPVMQGVFLADGVLSLPSRAGGGVRDRKFVGAGTFVGWSNIVLQRTFNDGSSGTDNNLYPTALFVYRPDLLLNAPGEMLLPRYKWQEIAP
jgi:hypothetical protein